MNEPDRLARMVVERGPGLALFARQWLDAASAEDVVQEALTSLLMQRTPPDDPIAWMFRAVRNAAIDLTRTSGRRRRREQVVAESRREWFEASPDSAIDAQSAEQALSVLPTELAEVVVLRVWNELGFRQIGEILRITPSTVHKRYVAALEQLRHELETPCRKKMD
jgi:RNA polymerase sigma-70 factor (ECF subfamily)